MSIATAATHAIHIGNDELPFVDIGGGNKMKLLHVDIANGMWIVESIFMTGFAVETHRHTGPVWAYTTAGAWQYREYDFVNRAGSFLFEPAGSVHTLEAVEDDTHVWFQVFGANLNLDGDGNITSITDADGILQAYYALCEVEGHPRPNVLVA
jgi:2,4'-dihydroxyacetophenone dioxygenase